MPITVSSTIAKIAKKFFCEHFNDFYDKNTYVNQFGCVSVYMCLCHQAVVLYWAEGELAKSDDYFTMLISSMGVSLLLLCLCCRSYLLC